MAILVTLIIVLIVLYFAVCYLLPYLDLTKVEQNYMSMKTIVRVPIMSKCKLLTDYLFNVPTLRTFDEKKSLQEEQELS